MTRRSDQRRIQDSPTHPQQVRVAGILRTNRTGERTFTLVLASGRRLRGVAARASAAALHESHGRVVLVSGLALFRRSGSVRRIEAELIEGAEARDLALWGAEPRPIFGTLIGRWQRRRQGPRSGVAAIFGKLPDTEPDEAVIEALERLS